MNHLKGKLGSKVIRISRETSSAHSFHKSVAFLLVLGQCFGLMPLNGITASSERYLHFTWKSWKVFYTFLTLVGTGFVLFMCCHRLITLESNIFQITGVAFFGSSFLVHILFLVLAKKWAKLMKAVCIVEISMRSYGWPLNMGRRLKIMSACILIPATAEHILVTVNNLIRSTRCKDFDYDTFKYFIVILSYPQVFPHFRYSVWAGILVQIVNLISTFTWTYIDLFIMIMSTSLALRFKQVTERVALYVDAKVSDKSIWQGIREDYIRLCKLCYKFNEALSNIVLISFSNNLFFILIQFFHSLRKMENPLEKVYFFFSFGFLITRTVCVCLYGAWVNDESQKPLPLLNSVTSEIYNIEVRRFIIHISFDTVALTGRRFFYLTRGLILSIAGTIVTYELVLIQFYGYLLQDINKTNYTCY